MKLKEIQLADLSRYRGQLMGAAIVFIILFHVPLARTDAFFGLRRCGNIGVDMFLFLSGIGLWYAWVKQPSVRHFYRRRLLRLFPAWLVVSSAYYLQRFDFETGDYLDLLLDITVNWGFWLHDELTFWYVPAIMMLYLWAPLYMKLIARHPVFRWLPVLMVCWCVVVQWVTPVHQAVGHIEIFWSRVPIFFLGINCGELVRQDHRIEPAGRWLVWLTLLMTASACIWLEQMRHGRFPLFVERMVYIPLTVSLLLLLCDFFRIAPAWCSRICIFLGGLSLEIYLIHNHFVMCYLTPHHLGYWPTALLTTLLTLPLAWLLSRTLFTLIHPNDRAAR
jgi:peptidoglycan/LPS O-acetylase OafA/YrhL